ncbi:hypothetical protein [Cohnella rhizosphaerae]|uniref:Uncharacterized protein n=1 Tax=Cohnella rhizosphaerae TaxID=1457232 RepID=A0A9X4QT14_9BACL|nr:hypothetical protein [Cohnella rhizosphaerae]MDG0809879.1 hypothetical protein [Cohnella rhizosphaerae]
MNAIMTPYIGKYLKITINAIAGSAIKYKSQCLRIALSGPPVAAKSGRGSPVFVFAMFVSFVSRLGPCINYSAGPIAAVDEWFYFKRNIFAVVGKKNGIRPGSSNADALECRYTNGSGRL